MKIFFVVLLFFLPLMSIGQEENVDRLKKIIEDHQVSSQKKLDALIDLCSYQVNNTNPNESIPYFKKMAKIASDLGKKKAENTAYLYLTESYMRTENFAKAKKYASLVIAKSKNDNKQMLKGVNALGRVYHHFQKYDKAISTYTKGIEECKKNKDQDIISNIYMNMGICYDRLEMNEKQMDCYLKGLEAANLSGYSKSQNFALYTIASEYTNLEQYGQAEKYHLESLAYAKSNQNTVYINMNYRGLGILYSRWGKYDAAMSYNQLALKAYRRTGNKLYVFDVLNNIAVLYYRMDDPENSIAYGKQALILAEEIKHELAINGAKETLANSYLKLGDLEKSDYYFAQILPQLNNPLIFSTLAKVSLLENISSLREKQGRYVEALAYFKQLKDESDTLKKKERFKHITELETKYQSENKERKNLKLQLDNKKVQAARVRDQHKASIITYSLIGLLVLILSISLFVRQRNKTQELAMNGAYQQLLLDQSASIEQGKWQERERIGNELHTDITNDLTSIFLALDGTIKEEGPREFVKMIKETAKKTRALSKGLINQTKPSKTTLFLIIKQVISRNQHPKLRVDWEMEPALQEEKFTEKSQVLVHYIIKEGLNNIHEHSEATIVHIHMSQKDQTIELTISDNGKGLPETINYGIGLKQIKNNVKKLGGKVFFESNEGMTIRVLLPKTKLLS